MKRKIVSLMLIPFVLLTQSVTFGHSHVGNQPAGHGLRAHIHISSEATDQRQSHVHSHGTHSHADENHSHSEQDKQHSYQLESPFDHDSSAVYLNSIDLTAGSRSSISLDFNELIQLFLPGTDLSIDTAVSYGPERSVNDCAPSDPDSPLFIRHHAILI